MLLEAGAADHVASLFVALAGLYEARASRADADHEPGRRQAYEEAAVEARAFAAKLRGCHDGGYNRPERHRLFVA